MGNQQWAIRWATLYFDLMSRSLSNFKVKCQIYIILSLPMVSNVLELKKFHQNTEFVYEHEDKGFFISIKAQYCIIDHH